VVSIRFGDPICMHGPLIASLLCTAGAQDEGCWLVEAQEFDDLGLDAELQCHMHRITYRG